MENQSLHPSGKADKAKNKEKQETKKKRKKEKKINLEKKKRFLSWANRLHSISLISSFRCYSSFISPIDFLLLAPLFPTILYLRLSFFVSFCLSLSLLRSLFFLSSHHSVFFSFRNTVLLVLFFACFSR